MAAACSLAILDMPLHCCAGIAKMLPACGGTETQDSVLEASLNLPHADLGLPIVGQHVPIPASLTTKQLVQACRSIYAIGETRLLIGRLVLCQSCNYFRIEVLEATVQNPTQVSSCGLNFCFS